MKTLTFILSVALIGVLPSLLIYTFFDVYIHLHPLFINIITGTVMFLFGGVSIAYSNTKDSKKGNEVE